MSREICGFIPDGSVGRGSYGFTLGKEHVSLHKHEKVANWTELAKFIPFDAKDSSYNIGDYGTADGAASMELIRNLIVSLRECHGKQVEFQIIYEDQPLNDFNFLFSRLSGRTPDPPSYLLELDNVFPLASGINFRKQCVPSNSMHIIMSMISIHWLSTRPVVYNDSLYLNNTSSPEVRKLLFVRGQEDWKQFLLMRSKELRAGGLLVVTCPSEREDEDGGRKTTLDTYLEIVSITWRKFRNEGKITENEYLNTNYDFYLYPLDDLKLPFEDKTSLVFKSGLRLLSAEIFQKLSVFYTEWKNTMDQDGIDDRSVFARNYMAACWKMSYGTFLQGLADNRTEDDKMRILDELYQTVEREIETRSPEDFKNDNFYNYVLIRKE